MNPQLQTLLDFFQQNKTLTAEEKIMLEKTIKKAKSDFEISEFKLERTEKVKRTTAILLEETIEELEQKRKAVEAQNRELEIESALERVRTVAMSMRKPDDLFDICEILYAEFQLLGFSELRNVMINIYEDDKPYFLNYDYAPGSGKTVTKIPYNFHPLIDKQVRETKNAGDTFNEFSFTGQELKDFRELRKNNGEQDDSKLDNTSSLHYYFYSIGNGSIGISTYNAVTDEKKNVLKRFRNVFDLAYKRYTDITLAEAQAHEAKIEASLERLRAVAMSMRKSEEVITVCKSMYKELTVLGFTNIRNSQIAIKNDAKQSYTISVYSGDDVVVMREHPYKGSPIVEELYKELGKSKDVFYKKEFSGKEFEGWRRWKESLSELKNKREKAATSLCFYLYSIGEGHLGISTYNPITEDQEEIIKRFKNVFELSYQRYSDVAKAEAQARESQIELALERVRARTMAMQHSDELAETSFVLFQQFEELGKTSDQISIGIFKEDENVMELYSTLYGLQWKEAARADLSEPVVMKKIHAAWKKKKHSMVIDLQGDQLKKYNTYRNKLSNLKYTEKRWVIQVALFSKGVITFSTTEPHPKETIQLLERFAVVFDGTYTRFLDLKKAEAQARESQIELGLERVRARAMAMQKSNELKELISTVFTELTKLDLVLTRCRIMIFDPISNGSTWWMANSEAPKDPIGLYVKNNQLPPYAAYIKAWKERKNKWQYVLEEKDKKDWDEFLFTQTELLHLPDFVIAGMKAPDRVYLSASFNNFGCLNLASLEPLSAEHFDILLRFAKVFELTYTRFNDLQKAEAQTRESQIELALERVRARTMAMQKSKELKEVIKLVYDQFVHLNINVEHTGFILDYKERDDMFIWLADKHEVPSQVTIPYFDSSHWNSFIDAKAKGKNFFPTLLSFEEKNKFYQDLFKLFPVPDEAKEYYFSCPGLAGSTVLLDNISLYIENFEGIPFTDEENDTLMRLGKVFQQTYTRFLDLQKAEAQARESQIQLALERVRARTMAMQKSGELQDAAILLFQQMKALGVQTGSCGFNIWNKHEKAATVWMSSAEGGLQAPFKMPHTESAIYKNVYAAMKNGEDLLMKEVGGKTLKKHFDYLSTLPGIGDVIKHLRETGYSFPEKMVYHFAFFNNGYLSFHLHEHSTEAPDIFKRFAKVFEQTYTRFLDLQKAEAQAREAKIEAALERVRSRTMGMQHSNELAEGASLLFKQVSDFGINVWSSGFNIWQPDGVSCTINMCNPDGSIAAPYPLPHTEYIFFQKIYEAKQKGEDFLVLETGGKELEETYQYMFSLPAVKKMLTGMEDTGSQIPKFQVNHCAFFSQGYLMFITYEPCPEMWDIFKRFAKVFEQTYTRFLDLQKAEAQAREAKIEAALEKVRNRSLTMHKSDELQAVVNEVFERLRSLDIDMNVASIFIFKESSKDWEQWVASPDTDYSTHFHLPYTDNEIFKNLEDAKKSGKDFYAAQYSFDQKNEWFNYAFDNTEYSRIPDERKKFLLESEFFKISFALAKNTGLQIAKYSGENFSEKDNDALRRFSKVFEQAYMRFLDLQKAEAQAREAEIQLALERVRARTMAMQHSDELSKTASEMFKQIQTLGMHPWGCGFNIFDKDEKAVTQFMSLADGGISPPFRTPLTEDPFFINIYKARQQKKELLVMESKGESLAETYHYMFSLRGSGEIFGGLENSGFEMPKFQITHCAYFSQGYLVFITYEPVPEAHEIFIRFAKVFEQTYTRFLDLQKAEAQARESQIQLALERVRSRAMAMQTSEELNALIGTVFTELTKLDLVLTRCVIQIYEGNEKGVRWLMANSETPSTPMSFFVKYADMPFFNEHLKGWHNRSLKWQYCLEGENKIETDGFLFNETELSLLPDFVIEGMKSPDRVYLNASFNNFGNLTLATLEPLSEEHFDILLRFAKVFDLTYTRFNDLQKAEAQARESQIQLALERVRARTMAMQKSDELAETASVLFQQMNVLGNTPERLNIGVINEEKGFIETWATEQGGNQINHSFNARLDEPTTIAKMYEGWKAKKTSMVVDISGKELKQWIHYLQDELKMPVNEEILQNRRVQSVAYFKEGFILMTTPEPLSAETISLLERFADVFNLTYTRFLDLQKAEAQAREATIEAALERVRSKTMAMFKSSDLLEVISVLSEQFLHLGFKIHSANFNTSYRQKDWNLWLYNPGTPMFPDQIHIPYLNNPFFNRTLESLANGADFTAFVFTKEEKNGFLDHLYSTTIAINTSEERKRFAYNAPGFAWSTVYLKNTALTIANYDAEPYTEEQNAILRRFGNAFEQTYTRFLDLQKAEAQAQEAKIEAALERVRARTMAMYKSENLNTVTEVVFNELEKLELGILRCGIGIINKEERSADTWITSVSDEGKTVQVSGTESMDLHPLLQGVYNAWLTNSDFSYILEGEDLVQYYKTSGTGKVRLPDSQLILSVDKITKQYYQIAVFEAGGLFAFSANAFPEEAKMVMKRFAAVFNQSYTRFLDLQKAEAQTREAKIEASLERVRGKAMSMHSSRDLADTIDVFYHEIELLSITPRRCGVGLMDKETHAVELSTMNTTEQGDSIEIIGKLKLAGHSVLEGIYDNWILQKEYHPVLRGNEIKEYYKLIRPQIAYPDYPTDMAQYGYFFFFNEGGVYAWTEKELSEDELKIYRRFTSVLSLTYKRYKDLKDAESNTREAIKRASLDRVRAETASMRTTGDLEKITPLIWNELTTLRVPFIRCGVFIMDEQQKQIHSFLSTPDGKAIAAFQLPYHSAGELSKVLAHWHKNEIFKDHWDEATFVEWTKSLVNQGAIASEEQYSTAHRPVNLDLNFLPFLQGMLYVGSEAPLSEEEIHLVQSLADAFSTAYARYEDFNNLEAAKKQVDSTLNELQATQKQLIQSEKMASLGELTAGIAHEIQNPLNFVNNFSDVNQELLNEMKDEMDKGNINDAKSIANDVIENEAKINHHGKRAGDIVKGMLQHSRTSAGVKEPTDINALADEYLRLSYHGLRAKDKAFNATMKTDFDESIGKINIIPQDIGRVLLNLFNNAFYAVNQQKSKNLISYEPTVSVTTKKSENSVLITVSDNGNGIPPNIVDKIFQPFFTTKPTGIGTGLGLSLSYDIVKAHGGEIKVETKEGEGTQFIIQLPTK